MAIICVPARNTPPKYFLVAFNLQTNKRTERGAEYKDYSQDFLTRGYWHMGYAPPSVYVERFTQMKVGDRIALKKRVSTAEGRDVGIAIVAIGIITSVDLETRMVYVNWIQQHNPVRLAAAAHCHKTIHGPFDPTDRETNGWLSDIFRI